MAWRQAVRGQECTQDRFITNTRYCSDWRRILAGAYRQHLAMYTLGAQQICQDRWIDLQVQDCLHRPPRLGVLQAQANELPAPAIAHISACTSKAGADGLRACGHKHSKR